MIAMMRAGTDVLLCMPDPNSRARPIGTGRGHARGLIPDDTLKAAVARVERARSSIRPTEIRPGLSDQLLTGSSPGALPSSRSRLSTTTIPSSRFEWRTGNACCLEPEPVHVTPADTTALYPPQLASALIARHPG